MARGVEGGNPPRANEGLRFVARGGGEEGGSGTMLRGRRRGEGRRRREREGWEELVWWKERTANVIRPLPEKKNDNDQWGQICLASRAIKYLNRRPQAKSIVRTSKSREKNCWQRSGNGEKGVHPQPDELALSPPLPSLDEKRAQAFLRSVRGGEKNHTSTTSSVTSFPSFSSAFDLYETASRNLIFYYQKEAKAASDGQMTIKQGSR